MWPKVLTKKRRKEIIVFYNFILNYERKSTNIFFLKCDFP